MRPEVLICGAGPVGLVLAIQLVRQGLRIRIVEQNPCRTELSKALVIWARSLELLSTGMPAQRFCERGRPVRHAEFRANRQLLASLNLQGTDSPFPTGVLLPQSETERILTEALAELGVQVEWQTELKSFVDEGDHVHSVLQGPAGIEEVDSAWLAGCDGAHSVVRHELGLEFQGKMDMHRWFLLDADISGPAPDGDVLICWHDQGVLAMFHFEEDRWRVIAEQPLTDPNAPREDPTLAEFQKLLDERGPEGLTLSNPGWRTEFRIHERKVDKYGVGRAFVCGDAAHVHSPAGGQGMNTGIQDACNVAWKLALVHRGIGGETLLNSYSQERSPIGDDVIRNTSRITKIATLRNPVAQLIRNVLAKGALGLDFTQEQARNTLAELNLHYEGSPINGPCHFWPHPRRLAPGRRVPDLSLLASGGAKTSLYEQLRDPRILVLTWDAEPALAEALVRDVPEPWKEHLHLVQTRPLGHPTNGALACQPGDAARLGLEKPGFLVIRPDAYLALSGTFEHHQTLVEWLELISN